MVITRNMARRNGESELSSTKKRNPISSDSKKKLLRRTRKRVSFQLPFDLIIEILLRLPVKSLIRFKLVSKTWYSLIQNPTFVDRHHITGPVVTSILKHSNDQFYLKDEVFYKDINFDALILPDRDICVLGICDGLLCVAFDIQDSDYIIGNPATREFRRTSQSTLLARWNDLVFFGFSSFSNEYKLVRVIYHTSSIGEVVLKAELYTMITDTWVEIDVKMARVVDLRYYNCWDYAMIPVVLNGIFFWEAASSINMCVVSFDISSGLFDQIDVPVRLKTLEAEKDHWKIIEFKEELSFIVSHRDCTFDLWTLNKNLTSWTRRMRIDSTPFVVDPVRYEVNKIRVAGYTRSGELLIEDWRKRSLKFLMYDLGSQKTKFISGLDIYSSNMFYFYTESLRSVKPRNDVKEAN